MSRDEVEAKAHPSSRLECELHDLRQEVACLRRDLVRVYYNLSMIPKKYMQHEAEAPYGVMPPKGGPDWHGGLESDCEKCRAARKSKHTDPPLSKFIFISS
jgi:hypothetical protein